MANTYVHRERIEFMDQCGGDTIEMNHCVGHDMEGGESFYHTQMSNFKRINSVYLICTEFL